MRPEPSVVNDVFFGRRDPHAHFLVLFYSRCLNAQLTMDRPDAETLALKALGWAAADSEVLGEFLQLSGLEIADLRARAADPELLAALVDFILANDARTEAFCAAEEITPELLHRARRALPGVSDY
jgi:hypothetical protein